jgi:hypothetical protein
VTQSLGERRRPEGPVTADVDASQKDRECHESPHDVAHSGTDLRSRIAITPSTQQEAHKR